LSALTDFFANATLRIAFLIALHACALLTLGTLMLVNAGGAPLAAAGRNFGRDIGWFGILKGTCIFLSVIAGLINHALPDSFFAAFYLCFNALAYASLARGTSLPGRWRKILLATIVAQGVATALQGVRFTEPLFPWLVALPGLCVLLFCIREALRHIPREERFRRAALFLLAAGLLSLALLDVFGGRRYYIRFQGWSNNTLSYYVRGETWPVALGTLSACTAMLGAWCGILSARNSLTTDRRPFGLKLSLLLLPLTVILITGGGFIILNSVNADANSRTARLYTVRLKTVAAILLNTEDHERAAILSTLIKTDTDLEGAFIARFSSEDTAPKPWLAADDSVPLPPVIYDWRRQGRPENRFFTSNLPFSTNIIEDSRGRCILLCHPWPEQAGDWLILRVSETSWIHTKGRAVTLAAVAILLTAFVGLSALVALFKAAHSRTWQRAHDKADALARARGESLAYLSHELRTPLQNVLGYTELLSLSRIDSSQLRFVQAVQSQSRHLLVLVNDFLDLAALEAGRLSIRSEPLSLRELVCETVEAARPRGAAKNLTLETRFAADAPDWVHGDAARLRQILSNLVDNAVKFTERGGVTVHLSGTSEPAGITLLVSDTGPGLDAEAAAKLFRPFERLQTRAEGTGLGLVMTRRLCEAQRGRIELSSQPGHGSEFRVWLPLLPCATPPAPAPTAPHSRPAGKCLNLLVVDDHPLIRELLAELLNGLGHQVTTAPTGKEALKLLAQNPFDGVLLDLNMPGLDGIQTATLLTSTSRDHGRPAPRLIGLSAEVSDDQRHQALAAGMEAFLVKPASLESIASLFPGVQKSSDTIADWIPADTTRRWRESYLLSLPGNLEQVELLAARSAWDEAKAEIHYLKNGALVAADPDLLRQIECLQSAAQQGDTGALAEACRHLRSAPGQGAAHLPL
jgi:signal transduction histidine kinase/DNA-binding NarL/FixJ family response regulator